jgi:hypothetical protein
MSRAKEAEGAFSRTQLCRTALLLYILSLEGLINRAMDHLLPEKVRDFILEREERFSLEDKWLLLPLLISGSNSSTFDKGSYPWSHFAELVKIRNDFVHPKHDRVAFYKVIDTNTIDKLQCTEIPGDLKHPSLNRKVQEKDLVYVQTRIPTDPYSILPEHVEVVKRVVDDIIKELDKLLDGRITKNNWFGKDEMKLVYPPGAKFSDLPLRWDINHS